jgi:hypothetical protein
MTINQEKLIQGRYEAERLPKNYSPESTVPDFSFNVLNPLGLLYRPVVDERYLENGGKKPIWPSQKNFAVCLTHDVDIVSNYCLKELSRQLRTSLLCGRSDFFKKKKSFLYSNKDPLHCYERWLGAENEIGANSTFFFWAGWSKSTKHHRTDCTYELHDRLVFDGQKCTVAEMMQEIDRRGSEIGLHPSWYSFDDVDELKRQKEVLEAVLGHEIFSVRQHYLHYDIRITPRVHRDAGFKFDSTLGFNDNVGFRFGTCYPWYLYDLESEKELSILEIPLIVQDVALLSPNKGLRLDENMAFRYVEHMTEEVEKVGGVLTLSWHPNYVIISEWWNLYVRTLRYLKKKNPWFSSVKEIGEWYKKNTDRSIQKAANFYRWTKR